MNGRSLVATVPSPFCSQPGSHEMYPAKPLDFSATVDLRSLRGLGASWDSRRPRARFRALLEPTAASWILADDIDDEGRKHSEIDLPRTGLRIRRLSLEGEDEAFGPRRGALVG
jgi:hypothetical protein